MNFLWSRRTEDKDTAPAPTASGGSGTGKGADAGANEGDEVNVLRYLRPECIELSLQTEPREPREEETDQQREKRLLADKEDLIQELVDILDRSGEIVNPTKFYKDMVNRERKATTAIAPGVALPHVRSKQVKSFVMGFARAPEGFPFASLDGSPTKLFFLLASPAHSDATNYERLYLKVYRQFAEMIQNDWVIDSFLEAEDPGDILSILRGYIVQ